LKRRRQVAGGPIRPKLSPDIDKVDVTLLTGKLAVTYSSQVGMLTVPIKEACQNVTNVIVHATEEEAFVEAVVRSSVRPFVEFDRRTIRREEVGHSLSTLLSCPSYAWP